MEAKFKIGDTVKCINERGKPFGEIGEIKFTHRDNDHLVYFDNWNKGHDGELSGYTYYGLHCWWLLEEDLELVEEAKEGEK